MLIHKLPNKIIWYEILYLEVVSVISLGEPTQNLINEYRKYSLLPATLGQHFVFWKHFNEMESLAPSNFMDYYN